MGIDEVFLKFKHLKVLVIGEAILDGYLEGRAIRLCREAPVPVVNVDFKNFVPGGAANTAVNIAQLGAEVAFISVLGDDAEARLIESKLRELKITQPELLFSEERKTLSKYRVLADGSYVARLDQGSISKLESASEKRLIEKIRSLFPLVDLVVVSDYNYGIMTEKVLETLTYLQNRNPKVMILDAKKLKKYSRLKLAAVTPSFSELAGALNLEEPEESVDRLAWVEAKAQEVFKLLKADFVLVTVDSEGVVALTKEQKPVRLKADKIDHPQVVGAGDTFTAVLSLGLGAGVDLDQSAHLAAKAASIVVSKRGTSYVTSEELKVSFASESRQGGKFNTASAKVGSGLKSVSTLRAKQLRNLSEADVLNID